MAEISYFVAVLGVSLEAAAALLGIRHTAEGGRAPKDQPVLVGERGPEVIVPNAPSTIISTGTPPLPSAEFDRIYGGISPTLYEIPEAATPAISPNAGAWDQWLADLPESQNIKDIRSARDKEIDNEHWRLTWDPALVRPAKKPLVQFPPAEKKSSLPDWLQDQEKQWLMKNRK